MAPAMPRLRGLHPNDGSATTVVDPGGRVTRIAAAARVQVLNWRHRTDETVAISRAASIAFLASLASARIAQPACERRT